MNKKTILLFSFLIASTFCKHFRLGHSKEGNLGSPGDYNGEDLPDAQWFTQRLNHYSKTNLKTWNQRYYVNDEFYKNHTSGPVFLMIGGEGEADPRWMVKGEWIENAKIFGAKCILLEHRYYGESQPTSDITTSNLAHLSSEQALADIANFISFMNKLFLPKVTKWVVWGGSYSGSLAAWMRLKYPHLVHAAVSSSGPLLAEVDFKRYFDVVIGALKEKTGSNDCANKVKQAHEEIANLISKSPQVIEKEFRVCERFSGASENDMQNFYVSLADDFADVVQYNDDNRLSNNNKTNNITINTVCKLLTKPDTEPAYKKLAKFNSIILDKNNHTCLNYNYTTMIKNLRITWWSSDNGRQWMYQACTEFGFFQTSSSKVAVQVFGDEFPVDFFTKLCEDIFGTKFNEYFIRNAVSDTNINYGGLDIAASRVLYVHGTIDPWHALGVTDGRHMNEKDIGVILINGTAHCANMYPSRASDQAALQAARTQVTRYLRTWLTA